LVTQCGESMVLMICICSVGAARLFACPRAENTAACPAPTAMDAAWVGPFLALTAKEAAVQEYSL